MCSSLSVWNTSASASRRGKASLFWRSSVSHTLIVELSLSSLFVVEIFTITLHTVVLICLLQLWKKTFSSDPKTRKIVQRKYKSAMVKEFSYFEFFFWPGWSWPSLIFEAMMKSSFWYLDKGSVGRVKRQKLQDFYHLGPRGGLPCQVFFCLNIYI